MGIYLDPGNNGFKRILNDYYVDKTALIGLINQTIHTPKNLTCISRPRRFGKSFAAQMLCAYYDCSCESRQLFTGKDASKLEGFEDHLNAYHVVYLDITGFISEAKKSGKSLREVPDSISNAVLNDIKKQSPDLATSENLPAALLDLAGKSGKKIIFIIDEWDSIIREAQDDTEAQERYLNLLREWFKNGNFTSSAVAAAYMTGILPIKKNGSQSAISDFKEYSMIKPRQFGEFVGFTEREVMDLCELHHANFQEMKNWYDGYFFKNVGSVYNPNSVMQAIDNDDFDSYWTETSAAEGLMEYISKDYHGLTRTIAGLIGGVDAKVNTNGFANDLATFKGQDDVLTLLVHLGYLAYDSDRKTVHIPNEEIRMEFSKSVREVKHTQTLKRLEECIKLFEDTVHGNEEAVAAQIEKVHSEETSPIHYNKEDSLRSVIKLAYYTYRDNYLQLEELPSGEGYADIVYLPKRDSGYPALVVELKWNQSAESAIDQILDRKYPEALRGYGGDTLLVGINYDKDAPAGKRKHTCKIVKADQECCDNIKSIPKTKERW